MDTPPPACSSPDLTGQDERGLRGSVGLCVAPCCDQTPYRLKTQFHRNLMRGEKVTRAAARISIPPPGWPVGTSPRRASWTRYLHHWRGISFVPRAEIRRTRGLTGARALSAGSWLGRRRFLLGLGGRRSASPFVMGATLVRTDIRAFSKRGPRGVTIAPRCAAPTPAPVASRHWEAEATPPVDRAPFPPAKSPAPKSGAAAEEVPDDAAPPTYHHGLLPYRGGTPGRPRRLPPAVLTLCAAGTTP